MSQDNQITLRGYLTAEPKFYQKTSTAVPVTEIRVGSTPRRLNRETGEWQDAAPSYYKIRCWRRLAINAASSLHKGDMVVVRGKFYMNTWTDNQQRPRATLEIEADSLGHDLAYGWSHYLRGSRPAPGRPQSDADEAARPDAGMSDAYGEYSLGGSDEPLGPPSGPDSRYGAGESASPDNLLAPVPDLPVPADDAGTADDGDEPAGAAAVFSSVPREAAAVPF
jgi:single-strand DNA-binding protein